MTLRSRAESAGLYRSTLDADEQRSAFTTGGLPVAVYGLGKMGLPLAATYADVTGRTVGVDIDPDVVATINDGDCHITREPDLPALVDEVVASGALRATTDGSAAASTASIHVVMVPTLLDDDGRPDLSILMDVVSTIGTGLSPGDLVLVESTTPPRTTIDRVRPALAGTSGLDPAAFGVAACPERTVSGQALADISGTHPKVVGGVDAESTRAAALIYDEITDNEVIEAPDATTAEAVKVFEGIYRDVNIALANELAMYGRPMGIDVTEVIEVANTQPFCDLHDPGPGVGGHCIPLYPTFLTGSFELEANDSLIQVARAVNDGMPMYTVELIERMLMAHGNDRPDPTVLLLGITYKANINELQNAPAIPVARWLDAAGARVLAVDPLVDDWGSIEAVEPVSLDEAFEANVDAVAVITPHDEFADLDWAGFDAPILDGRGSIDRSQTEAPVYVIGGPTP